MSSQVLRSLCGVATLMWPIKVSQLLWMHGILLSFHPMFSTVQQRYTYTLWAKLDARLSLRTPGSGGFWWEPNDRVLCLPQSSTRMGCRWHCHLVGCMSSSSFLQCLGYHPVESLLTQTVAAGAFLAVSHLELNGVRLPAHLRLCCTLQAQVLKCWHYWNRLLQSAGTHHISGSTNTKGSLHGWNAGRWLRRSRRFQPNTSRWIVGSRVFPKK